MVAAKEVASMGMQTSGPLCVLELWLFTAENASCLTHIFNEQAGATDLVPGNFCCIHGDLHLSKYALNWVVKCLASTQSQCHIPE